MRDDLSWLLLEGPSQRKGWVRPGQRRRVREVVAGCDPPLVDQQREQLRKTVEWARRIRDDLQPLLDEHGDRVHFRPTSGGVTMVGLLPTRLQRGRSGVRNLRALAERFDGQFNAHCRDIFSLGSCSRPLHRA